MKRLLLFLSLITKKAINLIKICVRKALNFLPKKVRHSLVGNYIAKKHLSAILKNIYSHNFSKAIVFENNFGWSGIMMQRPQQVALHMRDDILFLYHSVNDTYENKNQINKIKDNLYLINMNYYRDIFIKKVKNHYLMLYSTDLVSKTITEKYKKNGYKIIFEYVDEIDEKFSGKTYAEKLANNMQFVLESYPLIVATSNRLYDNIKAINENLSVKLITNGCDYEHFHIYNGILPDDIKLLKSGKPIVGYFGALASWFDYNLIKEISFTDKYQIVLIGVNYDNSLDKSGVLELENVHYLGKKDYEELPQYLHNFDVCIIPFIVNEITLSTSPVKLFEYMSGNKPIVTTKLPECLKYKSVFIGENAQDFINKLDDALKSAKDPEYISLLDKEARENSWEEKCKEYDRFLNSYDNAI